LATLGAVDSVVILPVCAAFEECATLFNEMLGNGCCLEFAFELNDLLLELCVLPLEKRDLFPQCSEFDLKKCQMFL
jgi:hypothetical protein